MIDANLPPISSDDLFTDEQMREFLTNGFVIIKPDLPKSIHDTIYQKLDEVVDMDGNPGNNLLVWEHPIGNRQLEAQLLILLVVLGEQR